MMLGTLTTEIRSKYPHPVKSENNLNDPGCYCVGGACTLHAGYGIRFPLSNEIANAILKYNKSVNYEQAKVYGMCIVELNDKGNFDGAWEILNLALIY